MKRFAYLASVAMLVLTAGCGQQSTAEAEGAADSASFAADATAADASSVSAAEQAEAIAREAERIAAERQRLAISQAIALDLGTANYGNSLSRIDAMRAINLADTPIEFQQAYVQHISAWEESLTLDRAWQQLTNDNQVGTVVIKQIACEFLDCGTDPIVDQIDAELRLKNMRQLASSRISETYRTVENIAAKFGAI